MMLKIGQLANAANVTIDTIRYYERRGLLPEPLRRASGYREYSPDFVSRLQFIRKAQELGFSLTEIRELLALQIDSVETCDQVRHRAEEKVHAIEAKIQTLQRMHSILSDLIRSCDQREPSGICPILDVLTSQGKGIENAQ
jgi:MerR family copper efflux transcriptional regulator